jgi:hypothetical protein
MHEYEDLNLFDSITYLFAFGDYVFLIGDSILLIDADGYLLREIPSEYAIPRMIFPLHHDTVLLCEISVAEEVFSVLNIRTNEIRPTVRSLLGTDNGTMIHNQRYASLMRIHSREKHVVIHEPLSDHYEEVNFSGCEMFAYLGLEYFAFYQPDKQQLVVWDNSIKSVLFSIPSNNVQCMLYSKLAGTLFVVTRTEIITFYMVSTHPITRVVHSPSFADVFVEQK